MCKEIDEVVNYKFQKYGINWDFKLDIDDDIKIHKFLNMLASIQNMKLTRVWKKLTFQIRLSKITCIKNRLNSGICWHMKYKYWNWQESRLFGIK